MSRPNCSASVRIGHPEPTTFHCLLREGHDGWHEGSGRCYEQEVRIRFDDPPPPPSIEDRLESAVEMGGFFAPLLAPRPEEVLAEIRRLKSLVPSDNGGGS